ncbi:Saccharopine dehydrogenase-domain-containing protein [Thelephora terrestris]|uniref:Saccharopine dehydrogenase-domain-containing protein n=1 Tax=Thelephora terrestris TaxID=56493 RepID=A0A9P6L631_9AGAM|nr:Saccharopine dehydrogenase-domain-containing protein [Thelephora terrestris]
MTRDILILGATGFTGQLIARYLVNHPQRASSPFNVTLGGRSRDKLNRVAKSLGLSTDAGSVVVVDLSDYSTVERAVVRAKVVINAVGPYWKFGDFVVRACARHGVHYVDITPEPHFIADIVAKYDFMAFKTNALVIPACGFDSIPPDIAVFVANRYVKAVLGSDTSIEDSTTAYDVEGGFSGGLIHSIMSFVEDPGKTLIKSAADYGLRQPHGPPSRLPRIVYKLPYDVSTSWYGTIWPQRVINRQTVHHSWSLFERSRDAHPADAYGDKFRYDECLRSPGPISALFVGFSICLFVVAILISPIRWVLKRILPQSGIGPASDKGHFEVVNITKAGPLTVKTTVRGEGEFAYYATARMTSEAALAILLQFNELPYRKTGGGGVLTPAAALGDVLIRRLEDFAGVTISSESIKTGETKKTR